MRTYFTEKENEAFRNAPESEEFIKLPDGEYCGVLDNAKVRQVGKDQEKKLILTYRVTSPQEFNGVKHSQFLSMERPQTFWALKVALKTFGLSRDIELSEVEGSFQGAEGAEVNFSLETKGSYQNMKITDVVTSNSTPNIMEALDGDIPF